VDGNGGNRRVTGRQKLPIRRDVNLDPCCCDQRFSDAPMRDVD